MKTQYNTEWKRVLNELYISIGTYCRGDRTNVLVITDHALAKKLDMPLAELDQHIRFLQDNGLVDDSANWNLTKKGFDVSFQNEKIMGDVNTQRTFLAISVIMMIISLVNMFW